MSDIELVVKIPQKWFDDMVREEFIEVDELCAVIQHGTLLPKEHGNLIDTKEFIKAINDWADDIDNYGAYEELEIAKALLQNHAHTIIEADKEQKDNGFFDEIMNDELEDGEVYEKIKEIIAKVKEQEE